MFHYKKTSVEQLASFHMFYKYFGFVFHVGDMCILPSKKVY